MRNFITDNELILMPLLMEAVNTRTISLLTMDIKSRRFMNINRKGMEEALKSLNIGAEVLDRKSNTRWDILPATEDATKSMAGNILTTKSVRLQTEYMGTRKTKVTMHNIPLYIMEDHFSLPSLMRSLMSCLLKLRLVSQPLILR